jgi:hypothetical protein
LVQASADGGISESLLLGKDQNGELVLASGGRGLRIYDPVDKPGIHVTPFSILKIPLKFAHVDQIIARGSFKVLLGRNLIGSPLLAISGLVPRNFEWPDPMRYRKDFEFIDLPREFVRIDRLVVNVENERSHAFRNEYLSRLLIHGADKQERPLLAQWRKDSSTGGPIFEFVKLPGFFASLIQVIPGSVKMPDICIPKLFSLYLIAYGRDFNGDSQLAASGSNDSAGFRWKTSEELTLFRLPTCLLSEIEILEYHKEAILKLAIANSIHEIKIFGKHIGQEFEMQAGINFIIIPNARMTSWDQRNFEQSVAGLLKMSVQVFTPNELVDLANDAIITAEQCEAYLKNARILEDFLSEKESQKMFSH